jgi:hypothetical protein
MSTPVHPFSEETLINIKVHLITAVVAIMEDQSIIMATEVHAILTGEVASKESTVLSWLAKESMSLLPDKE